MSHQWFINATRFMPNEVGPVMPPPASEPMVHVFAGSVVPAGAHIFLRTQCAL